MNAFELEEVVVSWIRLQTVERNSQEYENEFWSFEKLDEFCRTEPEDAWRVIVEIYRRLPDERVISNLAAGPVEDLLVHHGHRTLVWIRRYCADDSGFVELLKMVWKNSISEEVWGGITRLIKSYS